MTEIKPCPFCGGEAELAIVKLWNHVHCKSCHARTTMYSSEEQAIDSWNTRPNPWHTGEPTEKGWYLCAYDSDFYLTNYWVGCGWLRQYREEGIDCRQGLIAWQKIEPYKETNK